MITITITKNNNNYQKINLSGHALYADYGKDIVCSAVSSIVITTINGILSLDEESLSYEVSSNGVEINYISTEEIPQKLIKNMVSLLKELAEQYPTNIKVK